MDKFKKNEEWGWGIGRREIKVRFLRDLIRLIIFLEFFWWKY